MTRLSILAAMAMLPGLASAQDVSGTYQLDACNPEMVETRIEIAGNQISFLESLCTLTNPVAVRDMAGATLYDLDCQGEGERWTYRALLMPGDDGGLIFLRSGQALSYRRCN